MRRGADFYGFRKANDTSVCLSSGMSSNNSKTCIARDRIFRLIRLEAKDGSAVMNKLGQVVAKKTTYLQYSQVA